MEGSGGVDPSPAGLGVVDPPLEGPEGQIHWRQAREQQISPCAPKIRSLQAATLDARLGKCFPACGYDAETLGTRYDVAAFLSHRLSQSGEQEVWVRFSGFGARDDEWIDVRTCVRQRSHPCVPTECAAVLPGDTILCFQEGKHQALYFDAHVLDAQKRRHDARGCRCRFLVCYDHDESEEIVPQRKMCRRPELDYRLQILHEAGAAAAAKDIAVDR